MAEPRADSEGCNIQLESFGGVSDNDWGYYVPPESKLTFGELGRLQKEPVKGHHDREAQEAPGRQPSADSKSQ